MFDDSRFKVEVVPLEQMSETAQKLAASAKAASREAIRESFAAGLSITVLRGNRVVEVAPDGTETLIEELK